MSMLRRPLAYWLLAVALLLALPACRRGRRGRTARDTRQESSAQSVSAAPSLRPLAQRALSCADPRLWPIAPRIVLATGCGRAADFFMLGQDGRVWLPIPSVFERASETLRCPIAALSTELLPGIARRLTGCGGSVEYRLACVSGRCDWTPGGSPASAVSSGDAPRAPSPAARPAAEQVTARVVIAGPALRRCAWGTLQVRARWAADGLVAYSLPPPLEGTAAENCVRRALPADPISTSAPGVLVVEVP